MHHFRLSFVENLDSNLIALPYRIILAGKGRDNLFPNRFETQSSPWTSFINLLKTSLLRKKCNLENKCNKVSAEKLDYQSCKFMGAQDQRIRPFCTFLPRALRPWHLPSLPTVVKPQGSYLIIQSDLRTLLAFAKVSMTYLYYSHYFDLSFTVCK